MRHRLIAWACFAMATFSSGVNAFTGNEIRNWYVNYSTANGTKLPTEYLGYVAGVVDSMQGVAFCPPKSTTYNQLGAVVKKYIEANPEYWDDNGAGLVMMGLGEAYPCKK